MAIIKQESTAAAFLREVTLPPSACVGCGCGGRCDHGGADRDCELRANEVLDTVARNVR